MENPTDNELLQIIALRSEFKKILLFVLFRTLALFSQKFPKADFDTMMKMTTDIVEMQKECCQGDMLDCMHDRVKKIKLN